MQSLKLTFDSNIFGQVVDVLLWGRIAEIRQANPVLDIVLVTFKIIRIANACREIFIDCVMDNERLESIYQFDSDYVREIFGTNNAIATSGAAKPAPFKINLVDDHPPFILYGRITGVEDSRDVDGYHFLDAETDFSSYLAEIMSPFLDGS